MLVAVSCEGLKTKMNLIYETDISDDDGLRKMFMWYVSIPVNVSLIYKRKLWITKFDIYLCIHVWWIKSEFSTSKDKWNIFVDCGLKNKGRRSLL